MTSTEQGAVCATRSETLPSAWTPVSAHDPSDQRGVGLLGGVRDRAVRRMPIGEQRGFLAGDRVLQPWMAKRGRPRDQHEQDQPHSATERTA
jgi:hypothetical protein